MNLTSIVRKGNAFNCITEESQCYLMTWFLSSYKSFLFIELFMIQLLKCVTEIPKRNANLLLYSFQKLNLHSKKILYQGKDYLLLSMLFQGFEI